MAFGPKNAFDKQTSETVSEAGLLVPGAPGAPILMAQHQAPVDSPPLTWGGRAAHMTPHPVPTHAPSK